MNEQAREKLFELLLKHGRALIHDNASAELLLQRELADSPRELGLLVNALRAGIPADLISDGPDSISARLEALTNRLSEGYFLQEDAARWCVESWAIALGVLTQDECDRYRSLVPRRAVPDLGPSQLSQKPIVEAAPESSSTIATQAPLALAGQSELTAKSAIGAFDDSTISTTSGAPVFASGLPTLPADTPPPAAPSSILTAEPIVPTTADNAPNSRSDSSQSLPETKLPKRSPALSILPWALLGIGAAAGVFLVTHRPPANRAEYQEPPVIATQNPPSNPTQIRPPQSRGAQVTPPATPPQSSEPSSSLPAIKPRNIVPAGRTSELPSQRTTSLTPPRSATPSNLTPPTPSSVQPGDSTASDEGNSNKDAAQSTPNGRRKNGFGRGASDSTAFDTGPAALLTEADLAGKSNWELSILRNEPFARHGFRFHNPRLLSYFQQKPWYHPQFGNANLAWNRMSATERQNAELIRSYQERHGMAPEQDTGGSSASAFDTLLEQVSLRELKPIELADKSAWQLKLLRNTPYAVHGFRFRDPTLVEYFGQKPWYHPSKGDRDAIEQLLSPVEKFNAQHILLYEKNHPRK